MATTPDLFEGTLAPIRYHVTKAQDKLAQWRTGQPEGLSTGFKALDEFFRLVDSEMITIAARPSMGKTALGMQLVENMAHQLAPDGVESDTGVIAVFSAEMAGWSLAVRMAAATCGVNSHRARMGKAPAEDYNKLDEALKALWTRPIWIDDSSAPTTATMHARMAELNRTIPVRGMLFDFMELGGDRADGNEERRVSQIALALKDIAKNLNIPVVALSQLSRQVEGRTNKMPSLNDLRYSGQIEAVSDVVAFITRPEYYIERGQAVECDTQDRSGVALINIAKNRNGPAGITRMAFVKAQSKFADLKRHDLNGG